jgi:hypothetical protein
MENMEQAIGGLNLQFFAEPGGGAENPPSGNEVSNSYGAGTDEGNQAGGPLTNDSGNQSQSITTEQYQNAIKGMNQAQQEAAAYRKLGMSPEQIQQYAQFYQQANENPQAIIDNYFNQNPQAFQTLLQQRMGLQQQPLDPYVELNDVSDPVEYAKKIAQINERQVEKMFEEKYGKKIAAMEQYNQQQQDAISEAKVNAQIKAFVEFYPDSGITADAVWKSIRSQRIPLNVLDAKPGLVRDEIANVMGGWDKYDEFIGKSRVQKHQQEIIDNNKSTAQLSPSGGVNAVTANAGLQGAALRDAAQARLAQIVTAANG